MCEQCHDSVRDNFEGDTVEAQWRAALTAVIERHPELGLTPDAVTVRFAPKGERECVRVNTTADGPRYELHLPTYTARIMGDRPPLRELAMAAFLDGELSYDAICDRLDIEPRLPYEGVFVSERPPINIARKEDERAVEEFETAIDESRD